MDNENTNDIDLAALPAWKCVEILTKRPEQADKCDWQRMREELGGYQWAELLSIQPQFAEHCDWTKLDGWNWECLLAAQPQFADKCDWTKLYGWNCERLLAKQPQFADKCDWGKLSLADVANLLAVQPGLAALAKEKKGVQGKILCISVEENYDEHVDEFDNSVQIGYAELAGYRRDFGKNTELQAQLKEWEEGGNAVELSTEFGSSDFYIVLGKSKESGNWVWNGVKVTVRIDGAAVLDGTVSPQDSHGIAFENVKSPLKFDFDGGKDEWLVGVARVGISVWARCAKAVPDDFRFEAGKLSIPYFRMPLTYGAEPSAVVARHGIRYDGFSRGDFETDWDSVCEPDITYLLLTRDGLKPFPERMTGWDWAMLLRHSPQYAGQCDWGKLQDPGSGCESAWPLLLSARPEFADKCDCWDSFGVSGDWNWARLLSAQPQFADKCDCWDKFLACEVYRDYDFGWDWVRLLSVQPQFADKCDCWDEFTDRAWEDLLQAQPQLAKYRPVK